MIVYDCFQSNISSAYDHHVSALRLSHEAFYDGELDHCLLQAEILNIIKHKLF